MTNIQILLLTTFYRLKIHFRNVLVYNITIINNGGKSVGQLVFLLEE